MSNIAQFKVRLQKHVASMIDSPHLFTVEVDKDELWNKYLDSFPEGTNLVYRERREFDCSTCRHFVRSFGNVVALKNYQMVTIWDFQADSPIFQPVIDTLSAHIRSKEVTDVFVTKEVAFGANSNYEQKPGEEVVTWEHMYIKLPAAMATKSVATLDTVRSKHRDIRHVFQRSLEEIKKDALLSVMELIAQRSLYKGEEWEANLNKFLQLQNQYSVLSDAEKKNFTWERSVEVGPVVGKIKNHSIGVLLTDVSQGMDLDDAVKRYENIVAPSNYKRPKAIFTKKMLEDAQQKLNDLGLMESLGRRYATLDDISVNNTLFVNRAASKRVAGSVFDDMAQSVAINPKSFSRVEEVDWHVFASEILPTTKSVDVFLENRHMPNLVSLVAPKVAESNPLFKWENGFSWAYAGNIADSMKERVKAAGGRVDGVLRFSIQWNDGELNQSDFDAHCIEPNGHLIYYANKVNRDTTGNLDVDIIHPERNKAAVENITWLDITRMKEGVYKFYVHGFNVRDGGRSGFSAEIEYNGQVHSFNYNKGLRQDEKVPVAEVMFSRREGFSIVEKLPSSVSNRKVWSLDTNQFHPVAITMFSPNYWDMREGIGHRHLFFMLENCVNDEQPNGFFNEYLKEDLLEHKRVFEALGAKMRVEEVKDQLSGLGFSTTKRNTVICKISGQTSRTLKVNF